MTHEDEECLRLGQEILRMTRALMAAVGEDAGYSRQTFKFRQGSVVMLLCKSKELADCMDAAAAQRYDVAEVFAPTEPHQ